MDKLKTIDADIIEMEKIANLLASGQSKQSMVLAVTDTSPEAEPKKDVLDSDGSLNIGNQSKGLLGSIFGVSFTINHSITQNNTNDKRTKKTRCSTIRYNSLAGIRCSYGAKVNIQRRNNPKVEKIRFGISKLI